MKESDVGYDIIDEDELVNDTEVDRYNLDELAENQASIHNKWMSRLRAAIKLKVKYVGLYRLKKAELFRRGRSGEFDLEGTMTDNALKNWVEDHPEFRKLMKKRDKYVALVDMLQGIMYTINQRKDSIEEEFKMYQSGYFAEPRIKNEAREEVHKHTHQKQRETLNKKMKKRKARRL